MENFYSGCGPSAWIEGQAFPNPAASVPNYMTSNAFIAWQYACIAIAAARDLSQSNQHGVLNVIELGSGIGKFSFLFLTKLQEMSEYAPKTREGTCAIRLIITVNRERLGDLLFSSKMELSFIKFTFSFDFCVKLFGSHHNLNRLFVCVCVSL